MQRTPVVLRVRYVCCSVASCGWPDSRECPGLAFPPAAARSGGRIVRAVDSAYTAGPGNWAPASRPVRAVGGVYTGRRYDVVRKEGAQDGDSRSALTGAGRGWRGVPGAGRVPPAGAEGALLPDARILPGRRGRRPGDDVGRLARHRRVH